MLLRVITVPLTLLIASSLQAHSGLTVTDVTPGHLCDLIGNNRQTTSLTVKGGQLNSRDFEFIASEMSQLSTIDLSATDIVGNGLPECAFLGMANLSTVILPETISSIGCGAFSGSGITSVAIPVEMDSIADYAFRNCYKLESIALPGKLRYLGRGAFANCQAMQQVYFAANDRLNTIREETFEGCSSIATIDMNQLSACSSIGDWALAHCPATCLMRVGTDALDSIGYGAMAFQSSLDRIDARGLRHVPQASEYAWAGTDNREEIMLLVDDDMTEAFAAAPVWKDFNIVSDSQLSLNIPQTKASTLSNIIATVQGNTVTIKTLSGEPLGRIDVYSLAGMHLASAFTKSSETELTLATDGKSAIIITSTQGVAKIIF